MGKPCSIDEEIRDALATCCQCQWFPLYERATTESHIPPTCFFSNQRLWSKSEKYLLLVITSLSLFFFYWREIGVENQPQGSGYKLIKQYTNHRKIGQLLQDWVNKGKIIEHALLLKRFVIINWHWSISTSRVYNQAFSRLFPHFQLHQAFQMLNSHSQLEGVMSKNGKSWHACWYKIYCRVAQLNA